MPMHICLWILSVPRCKSFQRAKLKKIEAQMTTDDKCAIIFFCKIEGVVFIILPIETLFTNNLLFAAVGVFLWGFSGVIFWTNKYFPSSVTTMKTSLLLQQPWKASHHKWNYKQRLTIVDITCESCWISLECILGYAPALAGEY